MTIAANLARIYETIEKSGRKREEITLVAVSKTVSAEKILEAYHEGCRHFGESRLQEALSKIDALPRDISWHFIGSLQTNKAARVAQLFEWIHSVDSLALAEKLSAQNAGTKILIQVNVSGEATKRGCSPDQLYTLLDQILPLPGLQVVGLMTMAPFTSDTALIRRCFATLRMLRDRAPIKLPHLSMGMSHDYPIALDEGATLIRLGSALFGERPFVKEVSLI